MDTSLEWKIVVGQRRFTSGQRTVGGEEEDKSWRNQVTDFMKSRNMEEDMAEDRHVWRLEAMEGSWLYRSYVIIRTN